MQAFNNRDQYAELLQLLAACDAAHLKADVGAKGWAYDAECAATADAVATYLEQFGVEYCDFDDAHFFQTCELIRHLQLQVTAQGGKQ